MPDVDKFIRERCLRQPSRRPGSGKTGTGAANPGRRAHLRAAGRHAISRSGPARPARPLSPGPIRAMLVTLLTDFGTADYFVGAMKGVVLSRDPRITVVDVSHEVPAHDVRSGAFTLLAVHGTFPAGTVHVGVVDPGVGSSRRPIVALAAGQHFVGPDNGLFSYVLDRDPAARVFHLTRERFFRHPVSATFHGRDVFAPVAAALACGASPSEMGEEVADAVRLDPLAARRAADGSLLGTVIHVDRFGNCVTSVAREDVPEGEIEAELGGRRIRSVRRYFGEGEPGEPFGIWGSAGLLEVAVDRDSAARALGVRRGDPVVVRPR